jgi:hypothetical protein
MSTHTLPDVLEKAHCSFRDAVISKRLFYIYAPAVVFAHSVLYVGVANEAVLATLKALLPNTVTGKLIPTNVWIAGLVEPFFSKLFPVALIYAGGSATLIAYVFAALTTIAIAGLTGAGVDLAIGLGGVTGLVVFGLIRFRLGIQAFTCFPTRGTRWIVGALVGLTFGVVEAYMKVFADDGVLLPFLWEFPSFHPTIIPPIFLHVFEGALVAGTYLFVIRSARYDWKEKALRISGALALAMGVHTYWNAEFARIETGGCIDNECFWQWWTANFSLELVTLVAALFAFGIWVLVETDQVYSHSTIEP